MPTGGRGGRMALPATPIPGTLVSPTVEMKLSHLFPAKENS